MKLSSMRHAEVVRKTAETEITLAVDLDGTGASKIATGVGFLDHMLELLSRHAMIDLEVAATGDVHVDFHHVTEDVGIALGQAVKKALGDMKGLTRYADCLMPMDETLTRVAVDVSGRPFLVWRTTFPAPKIGQFDSELVREFFQAFSTQAAVTLHVETLYGANAHHIAESCFKGLARCLKSALAVDPRGGGRLPSTKGRIGD